MRTLAVAAIAIGLFSASASAQTSNLKVLYQFCGNSCTGGLGRSPNNLVIDANGNLFGTSGAGNTDPTVLDGTLFEIEKTLTGYANTPSVLVHFNGFNGEGLGGGYNALMIDASGNLFGAAPTSNINFGTVYEIIKTDTGYATDPILLARFQGTNGYAPQGGVIADNNGNLFGTTTFGPQVPGGMDFGTVFEIARTPTGYATSPTTLVNFNNFNGTNGAMPVGGLLIDANRNLIGTTISGGTYNLGTVFLVPNTQTGYSDTPIVLANFNRTNGADPVDALVMDGQGNLFGTTTIGGQYGLGTVFEIPKTTTGYQQLITLVNFNGLNGFDPISKLVLDNKGNLFGVTNQGGATYHPGTNPPGVPPGGFGTVFEILKTATGYANTPTVLVSFDNTVGYPNSLISNGKGRLFGTAQQSASGGGAVFEIMTFAGIPGTPQCIGVSTTALSKQYGSIIAAVAPLEFTDVMSLQNAVIAYCGSPAS